ncbi:MAG: LPS export ABC transporter periplasmic protein LptC [Bryobacterales bacterium]|nr:LPS export ABC transporter periplasmic protein LptC [Bryobacteraceae bacterium]MDW8131852.1 LPS export ABC transporter periplasmic protein LptC [Bryobacterales bacterium]
MRGKRGLLPLAIAGILAGVSFTYWQRRQAQQSQSPVQPAALPPGIGAAARDWLWSRNIGDRPRVEIRARNFRHLQAPERIELEQVELRLYHSDGRRFDQVRCAHAVFDPAQAILQSQGEVEFTMGLRAEPALGRLVWIRASGVTFDNRTGRVWTEQPTRFRFDQGEGSAVGASYDPGSRELHLHSKVELSWRGRGPRSRPMRLEAGELIYKENDAVVLLFPWARLHRQNAVLEAGDTLVILREGSIREVQARRARGQERSEGILRSLAADHVRMELAPSGELEKLTAEGGARLESKTASGQTIVTATRMDLTFEASARATILRSAQGTGNASLVAQPISRPGSPPAETRRLTSEVIHVEMRPGGEEIEQVRTDAPGSLEFVPDRNDRPRRWVQAERLWIHYGEANRVRTVRAVEVLTRSEPGAEGRGQPPVETRSRDLLAHFEVRSGELLRLEQWNDFHYREGGREGRAGRAVMDERAGKILLEDSARLWDAEGAIAGERLELDRATGDIVAQGRVRASRRGGRASGATAILSDRENLEAQADRMQTFERRSRVLYEGRVRLWQGSNRLEAHRVEIDRSGRRLIAEGDLMTQFLELRATRPHPDVVVVHADRLVYEDEQRLAHYIGGVRLRRAELEIQAAELKAWLKEAPEGTTLERAVASGGVRLIHRSGARVRTGTAQLAEYSAREERAVLKEGEPEVADAGKGLARGRRISWRLRDDSFEVEGEPGQPALSRLRRR